MKFLETFSKNIFRLLAGRSLSRLSENSIETTLSRSVSMLDTQTIEEIKSYIISQQTISGGFADRGGKPDLYYSLFGCFIAEALEINEIKPALKNYLKNIINSQELSGINLRCAEILHIKLFGNSTLPSKIRRHENLAAQYADFINLLAYYYSDDYVSLFKVSRKVKNIKLRAEMPCSVMAASLILKFRNKKKNEDSWNQMKNYYKTGSFSAFSKTVYGDLLSTGVALYSLRFADNDLSIIKPDCLTYIDSLYSEGGFCATAFDTKPDVEYTFYGLLGLGSLTN
jgi:prenyltransferase beta subunit